MWSWKWLLLISMISLGALFYGFLGLIAPGDTTEVIYLSPPKVDFKVSWEPRTITLDRVPIQFSLPERSFPYPWKVDYASNETNLPARITYKAIDIFWLFFEQKVDTSAIPLYKLLTEVARENQQAAKVIDPFFTSFLLIDVHNASPSSGESTPTNWVELFKPYATQPVTSEKGTAGPYYFEKGSLDSLPSDIRQNYGIDAWTFNSPYSFVRHSLQAVDPYTQEPFSVVSWDLSSPKTEADIRITIINPDYLASERGGALLPVYNRILNSLRFGPDVEEP